MGTYNVFKWNCALQFVFSIQSSVVYNGTTVAKVSLFSHLDTATVIFHYVSVEIDPYSCEQTSVIEHPK